MERARTDGRIVFTHDLDFGTILALTNAKGPSVLQLRGPETLPDGIGGAVLAAIEQCKQELLAGAIVIVEPAKLRVRLLPLNP